VPSIRTIPSPLISGTLLSAKTLVLKIKEKIKAIDIIKLSFIFKFLNFILIEPPKFLILIAIIIITIIEYIFYKFVLIWYSKMEKLSIMLKKYENLLI